MKIQLWQFEHYLNRIRKYKFHSVFEKMRDETKIRVDATLNIETKQFGPRDRGLLAGVVLKLISQELISNYSDKGFEAESMSELVSILDEFKETDVDYFLEKLTKSLILDTYELMND